MNKFKKIVASVLATATMVTAFTLTASANSSSKSLTFNYKVTSSNSQQLKPSGTYNWVSTLSTSLQVKNTSYYLNNTPELTWNFLNSQRNANNGYVYLSYSNLLADGHTGGTILAVLYEGCTATDAYIWTEGMVITTNKGSRIIPELRYDKETNRFFIVSLGTFESTFKKSEAELIKYFINTGIMQIRLAKTQSDGTFTGNWFDDKYVSASDIKANSSSYSYCGANFSKGVYETAKYANYVTFNRRICGAFVNNSLTEINGGKTTVKYGLKTLPRGHVELKDNGDVYVCHADTLNLSSYVRNKQEILIGFNSGKYSPIAYRIYHEASASPKLIEKVWYETEYGRVNSLNELDYGNVSWTVTEIMNNKSYTRTYYGTKMDRVLAVGTYKKYEVDGNMIYLTIGNAYTKTKADLRNAGAYINSSYTPEFSSMRTEVKDTYGSYSISVRDANGFVGSMNY